MGADFITPPPLERGDTVAIVSPASGLAAAYPHVYESGLERLRSVYGLEPVEFPTAKRTDDYLFDHPEERARDIGNAFADPEITRFPRHSRLTICHSRRNYRSYRV